MAAPETAGTSAGARFEAWLATHRIEFVSMVVIALATIGVAWAGYQAARWGGVAASEFAEANAARLEAVRASTRGGAQTQVDVVLFAKAADAFAADRQELYDFYVERFRPEFKLAFDAWLATDPLENADAPRSPFDLPEYRVRELQRAGELDSAAEIAAAHGKDAIQRSSNYVLAIVLFASALFICAISPRLSGGRLRIGLLALGNAVFVATSVWLATMPATVSL